MITGIAIAAVVFGIITYFYLAMKKLKNIPMAPDSDKIKVLTEQNFNHQIKKGVILIDFWASWCAPCRAANPKMVKLYKKYKDKNFTILGVSLDRDKDSWSKAIKLDNLMWTQVSDLKYWSSPVAKLYNVEAIPYSVMIDKDGKLSLIHI